MKERFRLKFTVTHFLIVMAGLVAVITSPFWLWQFKPSTALDVLIVDKTVPTETYREHQGLMWVLNQQKYIQSNESKYVPMKDYVGFYPKGKDFDVRPYPKNLDTYKLFYIADGYGVYEEEFYETNKQGERSKSLYGGMTNEDVDILQSAAAKNGATIVAEFNTFASPTPDDVKKKFYDLLNLQWTGWIGRYFDELNSSEVPVWVKDNYEAQYNKKYQFTGHGYVFVDKNDKIVILDGSQIEAGNVQFSLTDQGEKKFGQKLSASYNYWFDIVTPVDENEVLATYTLSLNEKGREALKLVGLPSQFPAIINHQGAQFQTYYFCGDYADQGELPALYQTVGFPKWKQWFTADTGSSTLPFFWKVYVPMMDYILEEAKQDKKKATAAKEIPTADNIKLAGHVGDNYVQVYENGKWTDMLLKGVNMGIAKPASFPGETAITKAEYFRWFKQIGAMNANTIRVYTIHPPGFYEALYEYNKTAKKPLYLLQGVWKNEEDFVKAGDAFNQENTAEFKDEITKTIDLIHGNAKLPERPGHASGAYTRDVSPYVLGWVLGVEWEPTAVLSTDQKHKGMADYAGTYITTKNAQPFEIWLASMLDYTVDYETTKYGWQRPMSFTNWVTTDLLEHPGEPSDKEDLVAVNPNVMHATEKLHTGLFASYHVYPYYPDLLNYEEKYVNYTNKSGEKDNYAGYLHDLRQAHMMPVLVAEFGVPSSRGLTHRNVYGMDQGQNSEDEQGKINQKLFQDIFDEKMAGGLVFTWQDEWFKRTWNTMDYDNPDRRPFWSNAQTNEQQFGMLSFDPASSKEAMITVDGDTSDWKRNNIKPVFTDKKSNLQSMYVTHDERSLYIRLDYKDNPENSDTNLVMDTISNQGQSTVPNVKNVTTNGIDFVVQLSKQHGSKVMIDSYYDTFYYHYGNVLKMIEQRAYANQKNNGIYHDIRLALNKGLTIANPDGSLKETPFESYETGLLTYGNGDPDAKDYNSLTDVSIKGNIIELRLPWLLLNLKDPSTHEVMGDIWSNGGIGSSVKIDGIRIGVLASKNGEVQASYPALANGNVLNSDELYLYKWSAWNNPKYHERLKKSYYYMKDTFEKIDLENQ